MAAECNVSKIVCFFLTGQYTERKVPVLLHLASRARAESREPRALGRSHSPSEAVEGGGHRVDTELEESLTEGEAGAGEHDAHPHGGRHHGQDQRQRQVPVRHGARRRH